MSSSPAPPPVAAALVDDLIARTFARPPRLGTTRVLGIDGPSGSGKTTLADAVVAACGAPVVRLDELYRGWDGLEGVGDVVLDLLLPLEREVPGRAQRWDWHGDALGEDVVVEPAPLLVLEGVGAGQRLLAPLLSLLVWVEAPVEERHRRGLERDGASAAAPLARWWVAEERHFDREATRSRADRIIVCSSA